MADWKEYARIQAERASKLGFEVDIMVSETQVAENVSEIHVTDFDNDQMRMRDDRLHGQGISVFFGTNGPEPCISGVRSCCDQLGIEMLGYWASTEGFEWALVVRDDDFPRSVRITRALNGFMGGDSEDTDEAEQIFSELGIRTDLFFPNEDD